MRCFISVDCAEDVATKISELYETVKKLDLPVKLVETENLHFTLNFLGDVKQNEINEVISAMRKIENVSPFKIKISGVGHFGGNRVKIIWIGVTDGREEMMRLMKSVNDNVKFGKMNLSPHMTIARVKSGGNNYQLLGFLSEFQNVNIGEMNVNTVKLKASSLSTKGPSYTDLAIVKLRGIK
jgi:2'-5' RNA ligase